MSLDASVVRDVTRAPKDAACVASTLEAAFGLLLRKAIREAPQLTVKPVGVDFFWGVGGLPLDITIVDPLIAEIPIDGRLVWAHLWAGDGAGNPVAVQARIDLRLTSIRGFGSSSSVPQSGSPILLDTSASNDIDISGWLLNYVTGDTLIAIPTTFIGTATWIALTLQFRPQDAPQGVSVVTDNAGDNMTFNDGSTVEFRQ